MLGNIRLGVRASKNAHKHYHRIANIHGKTANQRRDLWLFRTCYAKLLVSSASELAIRGFSALAGGSKTDLSEIILKALQSKAFNII